MPLFDLGPADRGIQQKAGGKAPLEQAADGLGELADAVAGDGRGFAATAHDASLR